MRTLAALSLLCVTACSVGPEEGSYRFHLLSLEGDSCGRAALVPEAWEGILRVQNLTIDVLLPGSFFLTAVGGQSLTGWIFTEREPRSLLAAASFWAEAPLHGQRCPAFVQSQLDAVYTESDRFTGTFIQRFTTPAEAPEGCVVQCATRFRFEAEWLDEGTQLPIGEAAAGAP